MTPPPGSISRADDPNGPWGPGSSDAGKDGPRNPWSVPPSGRKPGSKPTALDDFLRKARVAGGGGGGGGGIGGGLPTGPQARLLWVLGASVLIVLWLLYTSLHVVTPQQRGVVTLFGRYLDTLEPGFRVTLPAPLSTVTKVNVQNIRTEDFPQGGGENLMLTGDQNIIDLAYSVRWNIKDPEDFVFQIKNPVDTVRASAESAMREVVATMPLDEALGPGRPAIEAKVQERMQHVLDAYHSGVEVQGVAIKQADPPDRVNDAFKDVTAAQQDAEAAKNRAEAYAQRKIALAQGEAAAFDAYYAQYKLAPEVTRRRMYYETMEAVLAGTDKTIVEPRGVTPYLPLDRGKALPDAATGDQAQGNGQ